MISAMLFDPLSASSGSDVDKSSMVSYYKKN